MKLEKEDVLYPPTALFIVMTILMLVVAPFALEWLIAPVWGCSLVITLSCLVVGSTLP